MPGQPGLHSELQASQGSSLRPCFEKGEKQNLRSAKRKVKGFISENINEVEIRGRKENNVTIMEKERKKGRK